MKWIDKEEGPACFCGLPTIVMVADNGDANLVCIFHDKDEGASFPLPKDKKPENWPDLSDEDVDKVMLEGQAEFNAKDTDEDEHSVSPRTIN